eukprot:TRINITY_DN28692_c0_g1_i1.p1 TRINITY_DN28692_c0_g1~~TRINITY_DN28692_c0_g1_i1.p1  ORF type:complete len:1128 (+),score=178.00 TRINITY_DN28692_c0_g1_i1:60-3386(+)
MNLLNSHGAEFRSPQAERVDLRRSLSLPAAARSRKVATREYLRAVEKGNVKGLRLLALEAHAELEGCRAKSILGCDPMHLVDSSLHLSPSQQRTIRDEFTELPQIINAVRSAKALPLSPSKSLSKDVPAYDDDGWIDSKASMLSKASTPALAKTGGLSGRMTRSENNLTRLAGTLGKPDHIANAAKIQPQLLWEPARQGEKALAALGRALKSETLAVQAVRDNPCLLRVDASSIQKVMPVLISVLQGSSAEAAYAITKLPEILQIERPADVRDCLQTISACMDGNLRDAAFLVGQTTAPPSIKVVARMFCREDVVGEFFRIDGAQMDGKPVWCKPARAMKHVGAKARDMYLVYCDKGVVGGTSQQGCWTFTPHYSESSSRKSEACDPHIVGWAASTVQSPDQIDPGSWHFPAEAQKTQIAGLWPADPYTDAVDGGRQRGSWLYSHPAAKLRECVDLLREAIGLVWCHAKDSGCTRPRVVSAPCKGDLVHLGGTSKFTDLNGFGSRDGFTYLRLSASLADAPPIVLTAWEPVQIVMLYSVHAADEAENARTEQKSHAEVLQEVGFRTSTVLPRPAIEGAPELGPDVFVRSYPRGRVEVPVPLGPGGLPPLVFVRAHVHTCTKDGKSSFELVKPTANSELYIADAVTPQDAAAAPVVGEDDEATPNMTMFSSGELGCTYNTLLKGRQDDSHGDESEIQVRIEAADRLKVAVAWFHFPIKSEADGADAAGSDRKVGSDKGSSSGSRAMSRSKQAPPAPEWLEEEGWKHLEFKVPMIVSRLGERSSPAYVFGKDIEVGDSLCLKGSGPDFVTFTFIKYMSPARPDPVKRLLLREAGLLAAWDNVALLMQTMRAELGDALARHVLARGAVSVPPIGTGIESPSKGSGANGSTRAPWPKLCQQGSASDIQAWVFDHKLDALTSQLGGHRQCARQVLRVVDEHKAHVTVPQMEERCTAIRTILGVSSVSEIFAKLPELMTQDASVFHRSAQVIERYFPIEDLRKHLRAKPALAMQPEELSHLFMKMNEKYNDDFISQRLQERTSGEWIRWPDMVGKPDPEIVSWIGRAGVEERELSCKRRVHAFGTEPYRACAVADALGMIPEIPPIPSAAVQLG